MEPRLRTEFVLAVAVVITISVAFYYTASGLAGLFSREVEGKRRPAIDLAIGQTMYVLTIIAAIAFWSP